MRAAALAAAALALGACAKIDYLPPNPVQPWPTKVLMHRGGGSSGPYPGNTLPAVQWGAAILDGVEIDLQLSAEGTLWLGHDNDVLDCAGADIGCFQDLGDDRIAQVAYCPDPGGGAPVQHYVRLAEVFSTISLQYPGKLFSLDIKGQYCRSLGRNEARGMADQVDLLVRSFGMDWKVAVESEQPAFLERIEENATPVWGFVVSLGDVDKPLSQSASLGSDGISFKFADTSEPLTASLVAGIHRVGQRIIVWTVNDPADIAAVWPMQADVIETDNPDFMTYVP